MRFLVPLVWALSFTGLALAQQQTSNPATDICAITVVRGGCFGTCPRYTLTNDCREGRSTIVGRTGPWQGPYTATQVSAADFDQLLQAIAKIRFFDLPDVVGPWPEDAEVVAVTVTTGEKSKTVTTHDLQEAPASFVGILTLAEGVMDRVTNWMLWVGGLLLALLILVIFLAAGYSERNDYIIRGLVCGVLLLRAGIR